MIYTINTLIEMAQKLNADPTLIDRIFSSDNRYAVGTVQDATGNNPIYVGIELGRANGGQWNILNTEEKSNLMKVAQWILDPQNQALGDPNQGPEGMTIESLTIRNQPLYFTSPGLGLNTDEPNPYDIKISGGGFVSTGYAVSTLDFWEILTLSRILEITDWDIETALEHTRKIGGVLPIADLRLYISIVKAAKNSSDHKD